MKLSVQHHLGGVYLFILGIATVDATQARFHIAFSAECTPMFDWQSVALFYSFYHVAKLNRSAAITRLLACSPDKLRDYPSVNMAIGPTYVHDNMRDSNPVVEESGYPSYNKPYSVLSWLNSKMRTDAEYILLTDSDVVFRDRIDPMALGCRRGVVVSAEYTYLVGTRTGFARRFLDESLIPRLAQVGGFHIFHRDDLRRIAPLWLEYSVAVRKFAHSHRDAYYSEAMEPIASGEIGSVRTLRQQQSLWHAEMYGYVFASAKARVSHRVRRDVMLYPGYEPYVGRLPSILHYGTDFTVQDVYFNKFDHADLHVEQCPAVLFGSPRDVNWNGLSKKDALSLEHLATMDAAMCWFYREHAECSEEHMPMRCIDGGEEQLQLMIVEARAASIRCVNEHANCDGWAREGECERNLAYMFNSCPRSCDACDVRATDGRMKLHPPFYDVASTSETYGETSEARGTLWVCVFFIGIALALVNRREPIEPRIFKVSSKCAV